MPLGLHAKWRIGNSRKRRLDHPIGNFEIADAKWGIERPGAVNINMITLMRCPIGNGALHPLFHVSSSTRSRRDDVGMFIS
jgi:uncharacterized protein YigE (DUF2233 family)